METGHSILATVSLLLNVLSNLLRSLSRIIGEALLDAFS
jgi:hypothetical protein